MATFVATNFLISLFLVFPLYDFNLILLASQRASQRASLAKGGGGGRSHPPTHPWLRACLSCSFLPSICSLLKFLLLKDDRFVVKEMSRSEAQSFLDIAPFYFEYIEKSTKQKVNTKVLPLKLYHISQQVRFYYPYRHYSNLFIFPFVSTFMYFNVANARRLFSLVNAKPWRIELPVIFNFNCRNTPP